MTKAQFQEEIRKGIPDVLPELKPYDTNINHAPRRKDILTEEEKRLSVRNALRYFPKELHEQLAPEFADELMKYGRIYMYRYRPSYAMHARPIDDYPHKSRQAAAIMLLAATLMPVCGVATKRLKQLQILPLFKQPAAILRL